MRFLQVPEDIQLLGGRIIFVVRVVLQLLLCLFVYMRINAKASETEKVKEHEKPVGMGGTISETVEEMSVKEYDMLVLKEYAVSSSTQVNER